MSSLPKRRVAIVGGGIAGLSAAYYLTRTPELRARFEVTLYQSGFRLGGKLASSRNAKHFARNEEHGLHVWFGFYENAFRLLRGVHDRWRRPPDCPIRSWRDVFAPQTFTPYGTETPSGRGIWPFYWPLNDDTPGEGRLGLRPDALGSHLENAVRILANLALAQQHVDPHGGVPGSRSVLSRSYDRIIGVALGGVGARGVLGVARQHPRALMAALDASSALHRRIFAHAGKAPDEQPLVSLGNIGAAFLKGILDPESGVLPEGDLDRIDGLELKTWLIRSGADPHIAEKWCGVRALYDSMFQYEGGDAPRPSFSAATAARVMLRLAFSYKGAVLYKPRVGMGEGVIAPLFEVCEDQGVQFRFFHELSRVALDRDGRRVRSLGFSRQAKVRPGAYRPLVDIGGLRCFPAEPDWAALEDGERLSGIDFESPWRDRSGDVPVALSVGDDFDDVILALPFGAVRALGGPLASGERLAAFGRRAPLVPSMAAQIWLDEDRVDLGFRYPSPTLVGGAPPLGVWADMSETLAAEAWPEASAPRSVHYFCGVLDTELGRRPATDAAAPERARALARQGAVGFFRNEARALWPALSDETIARVARDVRDGGSRVYVRANVSPSDCCVGSPPGLAGVRPSAEQSGIANLVFAGAWVRTGLDAECVESAVMSGMQAARAVSNEPIVVIGEDFLSKPMAR